jgi:DNA/RNA endonuclease YhcR with UshA esterase domain
MEKEEKVMVLLLFMTLTSLMTAYLCFGSELTASGKETGGEARQYTRESGEGEKVYLQAEVLNKRFTYTGGHLLLEVDCNSEVLSVFIPKTAGAEALNTSIREGDFISLTGTVSEYEGKREIKVERKEDIILNNHHSSE